VKKQRSIQPTIGGFFRGEIIPAVEAKKAGPGRPRKVVEGDEIEPHHDDITTLQRVTGYELDDDAP
jgi:hypothetical protein